jgi:hypothetical protein
VLASRGNKKLADDARHGTLGRSARRNRSGIAAAEARSRRVSGAKFAMQMKAMQPASSYAQRLGALDVTAREP